MADKFITVELKGLDKLVRDLKNTREKAIPYAARDAMNEAAFGLRREWSGQIKATLQVRNQFTARKALEVEKASGRDMRTMKAVVGSTADYMAKQEFGGVSRGRTGRRPIPGPLAAGQSPGSKRTKMVRASNTLSALRPAKAKGKSKARANAIALAIAARKKQRTAVLESARGGFSLVELKRAGKRKVKVKGLLWAFRARQHAVRPHETLGPALTKLEPQMERITTNALVKQLKYHKVFGY